MPHSLILASGSAIRAEMLQNAGIDFAVQKAPIDEVAIKESLLADGAPPRDIADALAEMKAHRVAAKRPDVMVLGCDQILALGNDILSKPRDPDDARAQLHQLSGQRHSLYSAAVIFFEGAPIWRHVGRVTLHMAQLSDAYIDAYIDRNWNSIQHAVGSYMLEKEGVRLFTRIDGDYFTVLGMPLVNIINFLAVRGDIER